MTPNCAKEPIPASVCWSWRRLQNAFSVTIFHLPRRLEDMSWRRLEDISPLEDMPSRRLQDVFKTFSRHVCKTSWRQIKCLLEISISKISKSISDKSISHVYIWQIKVNPICINWYPIIIIFISFWNSSSISILRIKISDDCLVLWNQLNSNSTLLNWWGNKNEILRNIRDKYIQINK